MATVAFGVGGVLAEQRRRLRDDVVGRWSPQAFWLSLGVTSALLAPAAFLFWFHDELAFAGQMATAVRNQVV